MYINGQYVGTGKVLHNIPLNPIVCKISLLNAINPKSFSKDAILFSNGMDFTLQISNDNKSITVTTNSSPSSWSKGYIEINQGVCYAGGKIVTGYTAGFITQFDSTLKYPVISDTALLTLVQRQTFKYFWDFGHPSCGMARERNSSGDVVTMGGSGFGIMSMIVGINRGSITRAQGLSRLDTILTFLETCDRFHGAWPHWLNGVTGKVVPFATDDDGADLVETSYMMEGLLTMRQYLDSTVASEDSLMHRITNLYNGIDFEWFTKGGGDVLYWELVSGLWLGSKCTSSRL